MKKHSNFMCLRAATAMAMFFSTTVGAMAYAGPSVFERIFGNGGQSDVDARIAGIDSEDIKPEAKVMKKQVIHFCVGCHVKVEGHSTGDGDILLQRFGDFTHSGILRKYIAPGGPGSAEQSNLYDRVESGSMPAYSTLKPNEKSELLTAIKNWIDAGAPDLEPVHAVPPVPKETALQMIETDLSRISDARFIRYISLLNIFNNTDTQSDTKNTVQAVSKFLNSVSWANKIIKPVTLDSSTNVILRIDIRQYGWTLEDWRMIERAYPYANDYVDVRVEGRDVMGELRHSTGTKVPLVRADWMISTLSLPPFYDQLLKLPASDSELERMLGVNVHKNINEGSAVRAGFISPGISKNNRMIERHTTRFGAYWKSYDFVSGGGSAEKNLALSPIGPQSLLGRGFVQDGGELIFNLPNGMQAYMLVNGKGKKIDFAPSNVVKGGLPTHKPANVNWVEPKGTLLLAINAEEHAIVNGSSCIMCHDQGMKIRPDELGNFFKSAFDSGNSGLSQADIHQVAALYDHEKYEKAIRADRDQFLAAEKSAGIASGEPLTFVVQSYIQDLDEKKVIAELRLSPGDLQAIERNSRLRNVQNLVARAHLGVKRNEFEAIYPGLIKDILVYLRNMPTLDVEASAVVGNDGFVAPSPAAASAPATAAPSASPERKTEPKPKAAVSASTPLIIPMEAQVFSLCSRFESKGPAYERCFELSKGGSFQKIAIDFCAQAITTTNVNKCLTTIKSRTFTAEGLANCKMPQPDRLPIELRSSQFLDRSLPSAIQAQVDYALNCI